ncbi:pantoate--beta-alanine ligase [Desulfocucumis palustris]|uniref:Pantothenate synthetase n=1 Tax=Desulfocucumis palustris TaxID=1898651 RepID=A0A2L2XDZ8_9FIRM|nr:pantoate--beta-alanine ligase [Desulfocucumis palustris]GBF32051.1 pantoate--beta-alanine ligase [Desulfocucumis palustris]
MLVCRKIREIREFVRAERKNGKTIGFVPTMGYLHHGHQMLMREAKKECDVVVISIFVNPMQFGPNEDLDRYPRDFEKDHALAEEVGVDAVFYPPVEEMYPSGYTTYVDLNSLTDCLCGKSRPGHFRGVATVVTKLFNIVLPDKAFFGQKDAQQVLIIRRMAEDLNMPLEVVTVPIVREADGLAMSSRNVYLTPEQRSKAVILHKSLEAAAKAVEEGERDAQKIVCLVREMISSIPGALIDYVELRKYSDLSPADSMDGPSLLALAVRFGQTRLIDNTVLEV